MNTDIKTCLPTVHLLVLFLVTIPANGRCSNHTVSDYDTAIENYAWTRGCTPTAAATVLSYYDSYNSPFVGYGALIQWYQIESGNNVPQVLGWLALAMGTTGSGATSLADIGPGMITTANTYCGYCFASHQTTSTAGNDWCWGTVTSEIDSGRPFVWSVTTSGNAHSMAAVGYTDAKYVMVYDSNTAGLGVQYYYYNQWPYSSVTALQTYVDTVEPGCKYSSDVTLMSLRGGDAVEGGQSAAIQWQQWSSSSITSIELYYSTDSGSSWSYIGTAPTSAGSQSYAWQVPSVGGSAYRVRINAYDSGNTLRAGDSSYADFSVSVRIAPAVTMQPLNQGVAAGNSASFTVAASGSPTPSYQWQVSTDGGATWNNLTDGGSYSGVATSTLTVSGTTTAMSGYQFRAIASNGVLPSATSNAAALTVNPVVTAPVITTQPVAQAVPAGSAATFTVAASGSPTPSYQWQVSTDGGATWNSLTDGGSYSGVATSTLTVISTTTAMSGYQFRAIASNGVLPNATSNAATLTVNPVVTAPVITTQPVAQTVPAGSGATFTVAASGSPTPAYQWQASTDGGATWNNVSNDGNYSGVTTAALTVSGTTTAMSGSQFRAIASNGVSPNATSSAATLMVIQPTPVSLTGMATSNGMFNFLLNGPAGSNYVVQVSSDLVNWTPLLTNVVPAAGVRVIDIPISTNLTCQFFRALPQFQGPLVLQPGPVDGKDIWTTSVYSYAACSGPGPGGGLEDYQLRVGGWGDEYDSLMQFDLTELPTNAGSAVLYLYCFSYNGGSATALNLDRITQAWDWRTSGTGCDRERLWWADKAPTSPWGAGQLPAPAFGQWYAIDITDLYNAWQNGTYPNYGLQLSPVSNWNNFDHFYSANYTGDPTLRPQLLVTPANNDLIAYYPFDGDAHDAGPHGLDGTVYGALPDVDRHGNANSALKFAGTTDWVRLNIGPSLFTNAFTLSLWLLIDDFQADYPAIINGDTGYIRLEADGPIYSGEGHYQYISFYQFERNSGMLGFLRSPGAFQTSTWYHLAIVRNSLDFCMYINGALASQTTETNNIPLTGSYLQVGNDASNTYGGAYFHGSLDELRFYDRPLSAAEILALYTSER